MSKFLLDPDEYVKAADARWHEWWSGSQGPMNTGWSSYPNYLAGLMDYFVGNHGWLLHWRVCDNSKKKNGLGLWKLFPEGRVRHHHHHDCDEEK